MSTLNGDVKPGISWEDIEMGRDNEGVPATSLSASGDVTAANDDGTKNGDSNGHGVTGKEEVKMEGMKTRAGASRSRSDSGSMSVGVGGSTGRLATGRDLGKYEIKDELDIELESRPFLLPRSTSTASSPYPAFASTSTSTSASASTSTPRPRKKKAAPLPVVPVMIDNLPIADVAAHETFETLEKCVYERKNLGVSKEQDEMMVCDCVYDRDDPYAEPCGADSDCINRAIFIECLADECRARKQCRNQRFTKRQYAQIDIVQTEMKGFGLRAAENIANGSLIYEYIGEVVTEKTFRKRMKLYADDGIRHFYFMMLQRDEYIDATKKGGIGRFVNHSCNPNSEVQKWVVGRRLRMGIFTKRDVVKGEEITFNYNVDRYGHDAQPCYCGEPNCVGSIGGKTQTDVGTMNDLFLDALGITDEVEEMEMKGSKKKKSRQLDGDFVPILNPIEETEVIKVAGAMRQSMDNPKMMSRLLQRIKMTAEPAIQRQLMRMHGFSLMSMILTEMATQRDIVLLALESMSGWKLSIRNKVEDSKVEEPVKALTASEDESLRGIAQQLLEYWQTLELSYKIPRVTKIANLDAEDEAATATIAEAEQQSIARRPVVADAWSNNAAVEFKIAPVRARPVIPFARPIPPITPLKPPTPSTSFSNRNKLDAIIALAQQTVQAAAAIPTPPLPLESPRESPVAESSYSTSRLEEGYGSQEDARKKRKTVHLSEEEEAKKEKRMTKLVGDIVVKTMSKYKEQMDTDTFKRFAKECTATLVEKEKKGSSYASSRHPSLSEEKQAKMKIFIKEYSHKLLKKLKDKGKLRKPSSSKNGRAQSRESREPGLNGDRGGMVLTPSSSTPGRGDRTVGAEEGEGLEMMDDVGLDIDIDMDMDVDDDGDEDGDHGNGDETLDGDENAEVGKDEDQVWANEERKEAARSTIELTVGGTEVRDKGESGVRIIGVKGVAHKDHWAPGARR